MGQQTHLDKTKAKLESISSSFCLAKWKNATLHLHNGNTQSCHHVKSHPVDLDANRPSSLHNTPEKMRSRQQMLQGVRPKECAYCWKIEDSGETSDRVYKSSEPIYLDHFEEVVDSQEGHSIVPSFLELSFDHKCQFTCMYCSSAYSTSWEAEIQKYGPYPITNRFLTSEYNKPLKKDAKERFVQTFWDWWPELSTKLEYLRVTGGEPLLSKETFRLMDELTKNPSPQLEFGINTNLGVSSPVMHQLVEKLELIQKNTRLVAIYTSVDSVGQQAEYIRHGLDYEHFLENIHLLLSKLNEPAKFCFVVTVNALSLPGLKPLFQTIAEIKSTYPQHEIQLETPYLKNPRHMGIEILTPDFVHYLDEAALFLKDNPAFEERHYLRLKRIIPLVCNPKMNSAMRFLHRQDFYRYFEEYDRRKGTSFLSTFPEYRDFISLCRSPVKNLNASFLGKSI